MDLLDLVKEKGIVSMIKNYSYEMLKGELYNEIDNEYKDFDLNKVLILNKNDMKDIIDYYMKICNDTWDNVSYDQKLSEDFIREFQDKVNWLDISWFQKLSESFIRDYKDKLNWFCISKHQKLSENLIRDYKDKVDWVNISCYQKLSEDFIREFQDEVNWSCITTYQDLSVDFINNFQY